MESYHEMAELAPRDVVSRAIVDRMQKTGSSHVFLDVRHLGADKFARRFPTINSQCLAFDIDPSKDLIPVHPAAHYMVGGVYVDSEGRTPQEGLLACGEAACTGLHGANRLASNSIIEAVVFGHKCGMAAGQSLGASTTPSYTGTLNWTLDQSERTELDLNDIRNSLRSMMWRNVGIIRRGARLSETLEIIDFWGRYVLDKEFFSDPRGWEIQNMLTSARLITELALRRTETRGVHYREDFPETAENWNRHQSIRRTEDQLVIE
jgi:L-aspartate oxidase